MSRGFYDPPEPPDDFDDSEAQRKYAEQEREQYEYEMEEALSFNNALGAAGPWAIIAEAESRH